jgi:Flp pilus assembly pilin Flp
MNALVHRLVRETDGQDLIEYALLAATIALGVVGGMIALKTGINSQFTRISTTLAS